IEEYFDFPKHWKWISFAEFDGKPIKIFLLKRQGKFWRWQEGQVPRPAADGDLMGASHFGLLMKLVEVADNKASLSAVKEVNVDGDPCVGFELEWKKNFATCYFKKKTGLLARWDVNIADEDKKFHQKCLYRDYRKIDGVLLPFRQTFYVKAAGQ